MKASKVVFLVFLSLLSLCVVSVHPVKSNVLENVVIKADGSVAGTDRIQRNGNLYTLTGDISGVEIPPISEAPDTTSPTISIISPENETYQPLPSYDYSPERDAWRMHAIIPLTYTVSEPASWIGYSLDGQANVTITENTTLTGLFDGSHSLTVYAKDTDGNTGASETIYFSIMIIIGDPQEPEPFPTTLAVAATAIIAIAAVAGYLFLKRKK